MKLEFRTQEDTTFKDFCQWFNCDPLEQFTIDKKGAYCWGMTGLDGKNFSENPPIRIKVSFYENIIKIFNIVTNVYDAAGLKQSFIDYI